MGLFDRHDYGRDYRGGGRGMGDRPRGAWNRFESRTQGGMDRGYDRGFQGGHRRGGYDSGDFAYRGMEGAWSTARNRGAHDVQWDWRHAGGSPFDQDTSDRGFAARAYDLDYGRGGYDRDYGAREYGRDAGGDYGARGYDYGLRPDPMLGHTRFGGARREWREMGRGGPDRYGVDYRGWNNGVGDEPAYSRRDFRGGWGRGR